MLFVIVNIIHIIKQPVILATNVPHGKDSY